MSASAPRLRRTFVVLATAVLLVFAALLAGLTLVLRGRLRQEVLAREAESIHAVAVMEIRSAQARLRKVGVEFTSADVFAAVLESSRLRGVLGVQLFDPEGQLRDALPAVEPGAASTWWHEPLAAPRVRYDAHGRLGDILGLPREPDSSVEDAPLLDVAVPLTAATGGAYLGSARYWIDGTSVRAEFRRLDASLTTQAGVAFAGGAALLGLLLVWSYRRLEHAQRQLIEQSADLARANQELDFAAKTGALGTISAHLIHGLKNPLAGLEGFVAETSSEARAGDGAARQTAIETTRRLRALVNDVVAVLRDEAAGGADYPVPLTEAVEAVRQRALPAAAAAGVTLDVAIDGQAEVSARTANLAGLVLANLLTNAIEASGRGASVRLEARTAGDDIEFRVHDNGPGLPAGVRAALFRPVRSEKPGGGGMGLAISQRLARHAGGELSLARSDDRGTVFRLAVPAARP